MRSSVSTARGFPVKWLESAYRPHECDWLRFAKRLPHVEHVQSGRAVLAFDG